MVTGKINSTPSPPSGLKIADFISAPQVLPDASKVEKILNQFAVLMTRSLVERIPCLKRFKDWTEWHMPHEYADIKSQGTVLVRMSCFF